MGTEIRNALLYVDDAVRYDALVDELASLGPTFKTVAASTHTPTSFGSLLTGLYPPESGIRSFKHTVPATVRSVFDLDTHEVSLAAKGGMNHSISDLFEGPPRKTLDEVSPPFVHVVRRPGGHAPYNGFDWETYEYEDETAKEYLQRISSDHRRARADYADGVDTSFREFRAVLEELEDRGLREETLVVYTSDHGELLGEYGFFGHTHLATPEVVYVPTTFVHPDLETGLVDDLFHHVDVLPTVAELLEADVDVGATRGRPFGDGRERGYNHFEHVRYGSLPEPLETLVQRGMTFDRTVRSLWDDRGGHAFVEGSFLPITLVYLVLLTQSPVGNQLAHDGGFVDVFDRFAPGSQTYGDPRFDDDEARRRIEALLRGRTGEVSRDLDDETTARLEDMGYL